jgi:serine/threonine protein kinase
VHRDIKPANIRLNRRGNEPDVVKVLDFGLVRALNDVKQASPQVGLSGTPLYMSPEAFQTPDLVDARSDLYAVGAIGYFLITGQPVFTATSLIELCQQHVEMIPVTPSERIGRAISPELESAILSCLEKNRAKRPQTARDLAALFARAPAATAWSLEAAEAWWGRHERQRVAADKSSSNPVSGAGSGASAAAPRGERTSSSEYDQTVALDNRSAPHL